MKDFGFSSFGNFGFGDDDFFNQDMNGFGGGFGGGFTSGKSVSKSTTIK